MADNAITGPQLVQLKKKIVDKFSDSDWLELGALTDCFDLVNNHYRLLRSYRFGDEDYGGHALNVLRRMIENDPANFDTITRYVQERYPEEGENVSSQDTGRRVVFSPAVFSIPEGGVDQSLVSVMMPFGAAFASVYDAFKGAAADAEMQCQRADDIWENSVVIQDVFSLSSGRLS